MKSGRNSRLNIARMTKRRSQIVERTAGKGAGDPVVRNMKETTSRVASIGSAWDNGIGLNCYSQ